MSGNNHGYYYSPTNGSYPVKHWSEWTAEQQQYGAYVRGYEAGIQSPTNHASAPRVPYYAYTPTLPPPPPPPPLPPPSPNGRAYMPHRYQETSNDRYSSSRRMPEENRYQDSNSDRYSSSRRMTDDSRYPTPNHQYQSNQSVASSSWNRNSTYKRSRTDSEDGQEPKAKSAKKKKKPLSQNIPSRKDWKKEEAEMALACEKEYNKRHRNQSLIIKFPDLELNKEIVSKFHGAIENVHFQQPSTARFCFVTLEEGADADTVISDLKKVKFGNGYLSAEYKKDREEDQNIGPDDIDPYTLYVGNLAQEITKQDIMKTYPKSKRIDIGYAKKMKYTRYAFVTFKTIPDAIEAFKKTHSTQMYSKSLIVRFRRLHGTVGMPGESKPQNPPRKDTPAPDETTTTTAAVVVETKASNDAVLDLNLVKHEPPDSGGEEDVKPARSTSSCAGTYTPDTDDVEYEERHRPMKLEIKDEFKSSPPSSPVNDDVVVFKEDPACGRVKVEPKEEPRYMESDEEDSDETPYTGPQDNSYSSDDDDYENRSFSNFYESLVAKSRSIPAAAHKTAP